MSFKNYNTEELKKTLKKSNGHVVLWGAGDLGELVKYAFDEAGIKVDFL